jgi:uncharacterized protein (TIGR03086 family)
MSENLRNYTKAVYAADHVLKAATVKAPLEKVFTKTAPCAGWKGADVFKHLLGNLTMIKSYATTGKGPKGDVKIAADPLAQWAKLRDQTLATLDHEGALHRTAHDPFGPDFGPMPVDALVGFMAAELAVHVWDMARTAKVDERLDGGLVKASAATWKGLPEAVLRMPGMFGAAVKAPAGADAQTKLLNFLGRAV